MNQCMLGLVALAGSLLVSAGDARAQDYPGFTGLGAMVQGELAFQQQFYPWAWQGAQVAARMTPDDQPLPFTAMTLAQADRASWAAFEDYNRGLSQQSARMSHAVGMTTIGGTRGNWVYGDAYGSPSYELPYTHSHYHVNPYGYVVPEAGGGWDTTLYPYATYGW